MTEAEHDWQGWHHTVIYRESLIFATVPKAWTLRPPPPVVALESTLVIFETDRAAVWFALSLMAPLSEAFRLEQGQFMANFYKDVALFRETIDPTSNYSMLSEKDQEQWRREHMGVLIGQGLRGQFLNEFDVRRVGCNLSCMVPDWGGAPLPPARDDLVSLLLTPGSAYNIAVPLVAMSHLTQSQIAWTAPRERSYCWRDAEAEEAAAGATSLPRGRLW